MMRAILIDSAAREVREVEYSGNWRDIAPMIGAESGLFAVTPIREGEDLYVDDEGLLTSPNPHGYFLYQGVGQELFAGNGLVLGVDENGETRSTALTVGEVRERVGFGRPVPMPPAESTEGGAVSG